MNQLGQELRIEEFLQLPCTASVFSVFRNFTARIFVLVV